MSKYFGVKNLIKRFGDNYDYVINDLYLRKYLEFIGFDYVKAQNKKVPKIIMKSSKNIVSAFLRGLFDTDGTVDDKMVSLCSVSKKLIKEVQVLLLNFGIISRVHIKKTKSDLGISYILTISGDDVELFNQYIGFGLQRKQDRLDKLADKNHNTNKDIIPYQTEKVNEIFNMPENKKVSRASYWNILNGENNLTYYRLNKLLDDCNSGSEIYKHFQDLADNHYYFSKVEEISEEIRDTYDFHIPKTHSFVSNGFVSHNTFDEVLSMVVVAMLYPNISLVCTNKRKRSRLA